MIHLWYKESSFNSLFHVSLTESDSLEVILRMHSSKLQKPIQGATFPKTHSTLNTSIWVDENAFTVTKEQNLRDSTVEKPQLFFSGKDFLKAAMVRPWKKAV